jgi:hypothetical protein
MSFILRRKWSARGGCGIAVIMNCFVAWGSYSLSREPLGPLRLGFACGIVTLIAWTLIVSSHVKISDDGVLICNPFKRYWIPWGELSEVRCPPRGGGLEMGDRSGNVRNVWAFSPSMLDMGRTIQARDDITVAWRRSGHRPPGDLVREYWRIPWPAALVCCLSSVGVGYIAYALSY